MAAEAEAEAPWKLKQFKLTPLDFAKLDRARERLRPILAASGITRTPTDADVLRYALTLAAGEPGTFTPAAPKKTKKKTR